MDATARDHARDAFLVCFSYAASVLLALRSLFRPPQNVGVVSELVGKGSIPVAGLAQPLQLLIWRGFYSTMGHAVVALVAASFGDVIA